MQNENKLINITNSNNELMRKSLRQAMVVTVKELRTLADELEQEEQQFAKKFNIPRLKQRHLISIINKTKASDTWKFEK